MTGESTAQDVTKPANMNPSGEPDAAAAEYARLVRAAAAGEPQAMESLLLRAQEVAYRFSLLVCGHPEDAEDVMQDALLKTYRHVSQIREPLAFRTWLYRTVRNACLIKRRRRRGEPARLDSIDQASSTDQNAGHSAKEVADAGKPPDQLAIDARTNQRLAAALQALPPKYRVIVVLREVEGLSTQDVAEVLGLTTANVKTRLHRARMMLRSQLEGV